MTKFTPHPHTRPFNFEHAKAGAPVGTRGGRPIRLLDFNAKTLEGEQHNPITALVTFRTNYGEVYEGALMYSASGEYCRMKGSEEDLVMLPLAMVEGKPVFVGDELEYTAVHTWTKFKTEPSTDFDSSTFRYRWPQQSFKFKGRDLTLESEIWYTNFPPEHHLAKWELVKIKDKFSDIQNIRRKLEDSYDIFHMHYEWDKPFIEFKGRQLTKYSKLWHNPSGDPGVNGEWTLVTAGDIFGGFSHIDYLRRGETYSMYYSWEKPTPKVKKEVWQAVHKSINGRGKEYGSIHYSSEKSCVEDCNHYPRFIKAEKTDEYYE